MWKIRGEDDRLMGIERKREKEREREREREREEVEVKGAKE